MSLANMIIQTIHAFFVKGNYTKQVNEGEEEHQQEENSTGELHSQKPYRIELVGVVCDGYLAVIRGIRCICL
jgi:hypothetical protein